jgi:hypothetical protein
MSGNAYKDLEKQQEDSVVVVGRDASAMSSIRGDEAKKVGDHASRCHHRPHVWLFASV